MTPEQRRIAKQIARQLNRIAQIADDNELMLGNGALIGNMLGGIAIELEQQAQQTKGQNANQ